MNNNKYETLIFTAMNIENETRKLVDSAMSDCTKGMTNTEKKAYEMGISNTINALNCLIIDEYPVVHIEGIKHIEEIDCDELIEILNMENDEDD